MSDDTDDLRWNDELSDRETFLIGKVIAQWGALEHEVFVQTLMTFDMPDGEEVVLPKTMNNLQFTDVLNLSQKIGVRTQFLFILERTVI